MCRVRRFRRRRSRRPIPLELGAAVRHRGGDLFHHRRVGKHGAAEGVHAELEEIAIGHGRNGGRARLARQQRHLPEERPFLKPCDLAFGSRQRHHRVAPQHHEHRTAVFTFADDGLAGGEERRTRRLEQLRALFVGECGKDFHRAERRGRQRLHRRRGRRVVLELHLNRVGDRNVVTAERVVDVRPHAIADAHVGGEVGRPHADAVGDGRRGEVGDQDLGLATGDEQRLVAQRPRDHRLHLVGRRVVAGADLDLEPRVVRRLRVVRDRLLRHHAVRHDDEVARLRADLGRAPRHLGDQAVGAGDGHPVADAKRLLDLNRQPGKQVAQRVLQREADHDGADGGRRQHLLLHEQHGHEREQRDDDRVLDDGGEAIGQAVFAPGVQQGDDDQRGEAVGEEQRVERADLEDDVGRERRVDGERRGDGVRAEQQARRQQAAAHEPVHARAAQREGEHEERETDDQDRVPALNDLRADACRRPTSSRRSSRRSWTSNVRSTLYLPEILRHTPPMR